jgi:hypothetical protein
VIFELDRNGPYSAAKCKRVNEIVWWTPSFATMRSVHPWWRFENVSFALEHPWDSRTRVFGPPVGGVALKYSGHFIGRPSFTD